MSATGAGLQVRVLDVPASELGEGPLWHADEQALYWIDIRAALLHRWSAREGYDTAIPLPATPGCVVDGADGTIVVALATGLVVVDPVTRSVTELGAPPQHGGRYNDGAADAAGRLWVGTVESGPGAADGVLYRIEPDLTRTIVRTGLAVPNGIDFSPDGRTVYFTITERNVVIACDFDPAAGQWSAERIVLTDHDCSPDGLVVDDAGTLWSAKWSGSRIQQADGRGAVLREVPLPVTNITSAAFGGEDLGTLFVTTAADEPGGAVSQRPDWAGRVLAIDGLGARGVRLPVFAPRVRKD